MSRTSRNFVLAYIFLVGLPLIGLAGVLRSGRHLAAPVSVDGTWKVEAVSSGKTSTCAAVSTFLSAPVVISQSGRNLVVTFGNGRSAVPGALEDNSVKTSIPVDGDSGTQCGQAILTSVVDPKSSPRVMSGQLAFLGCPSCAPFAFHAVRQPKTQGGGGH
jgi:hypothetical protein